MKLKPSLVLFFLFTTGVPLIFPVKANAQLRNIGLTFQFLLDKSIRYEEYEDDYEEDNWGETRREEPVSYEPPLREKEYEYDEVQL